MSKLLSFFLYMNRVYGFVVFLGICGMCYIVGAPAASAAQGQWVGNAEQVRARLISAPTAIGDADTVQAALEVELGEGWHSYWLAAGDAGLPPRFDWSASQNMKGAEVFWPAPQRFDEGGFTTFGYKGTTVYPLSLTLQEKNKGMSVILNANIMICKDICIPAMLDGIALDVPAGPSRPSMEEASIKNSMATLPSAQDLSSLRLKNLVVGQDKIAMAIFAQNQFQGGDVFIAVHDANKKKDSGSAIGLSGKISVTPDMNDKRNVMVTIEKMSDVADLNAFVAGKTLHVVVTDGAGNSVTRDITFPPIP